MLFPGTVVFYQPGMLMGGSVEHECNTQRSIGYYLEALICLAPFFKSPLHAVLTGVTNDQQDPTVSVERNSIKYIKWAGSGIGS